MTKEQQEKYDAMVKSGMYTLEELARIKRGLKKGASGLHVNEEKSMRHLQSVALVEKLGQSIKESAEDFLFEYEFENESFEEPDAKIEIRFASGMTFSKEELSMFNQAISNADVMNIHVYGIVDDLVWIEVMLLFKDVLCK